MDRETFRAILWPPGYAATNGRSVDLLWSDVIKRVANPAIVTRKGEAPGWSFVRSRDNRRRKADILAATATVLDFDACEPGDFERVAGALGSAGVLAVMHMTHSNRPEAPRFRCVARTSRDMRPDEAPIVAKHLAGLLPCAVDPGSFDVSHRWAQPSHAPGADYIWREIQGKPIDVDAVLVAERAEVRDEPIEPIEPNGRGPTSLKGFADHSTRRADEILATLPEKTRGLIIDGPTAENSPLRRAGSDTGGWVPDRSKADFAAVAACIEHGCSDDEIHLLWETFSDGIGQRYTERGAWGDEYLRRTIDRARARSAERLTVPVRIRDLWVNTCEERVESIRIRVDPAKGSHACGPSGANGSRSLPPYITLYPSSVDRWNALFAAADLDVPKSDDVSDVRQQAFALQGAIIVIELDGAKVRRILPAQRNDSTASETDPCDVAPGFRFEGSDDPQAVREIGVSEGQP